MPALALVGFVGFVGCRLAPAPPPPETSAEAAAPLGGRGRDAAPGRTVPTAAEPWRTVLAATVTAVRSADARAPALRDPELSSVSCPETSADLPSSTSLDPADARLSAKVLLVADKAGRRLMLFRGGDLSGCWRIGLGFAPTGHKLIEGDGKTPEGWYRTFDKPWSTFEGAIAISYPNVQDARAARRDRTIGATAFKAIVAAEAAAKMPPQRTSMGGAVLIHGGGSARDWTLGCLALDSDDLTELREKMPRRQRARLLILP